VPRISEFSGIIIEMFHNEHGVPHFHAKHGESKAIVGIEPVQLLAGRLPRREESLVIEWARLRQSELLANWTRGRSLASMVRVDPPA